MNRATAGETLFEQYLRDRAIEFDYEVAKGSRRPDFCLKTDPGVFCEVKDFRVGPDDLAEIEAFARLSYSTRGPRQMYGRLRDAIGKKAKQLHKAKGSPCVVVLYNDGSGLVFDPIFIAGAMFGDLTLEVPLNGSEPRSAFGKGRTTGENKNTTVSAVAVLSKTNAGQRLIDEAGIKALEVAESSSLKLSSAVAEAVNEIAMKAPEVFDQVPCLTIHHNPFAVVPLPEKVFNGPHDRHIWP